MLTIPESKPWYKQSLLPASVILGAILFGWILYQSWQIVFAQDNTAVAVYTVTLGPVEESVSGYGQLTPRVSNTLVAKSEGVISHIAVYPGTQLKAEQLIMELDNPKLRNRHRIAELELLKAQSKHVETQAQLTRDQASLNNALELAKSEVNMANKELETLNFLVKQNIISKLDYLRAETKLEQATISLRQAKRDIQVFSNTRDARQKANDYMLQAAQLEMDMVAKEMDNLVIRADVPGMLNELGENIEVGQQVQQGVVLARMTDPKSLFANVFVSAAQAEHLYPGQPARVETQQHELAATVLRISPKVEGNQVRVELGFQQPLPAMMRENQDVSAKIAITKVDETLRIMTPQKTLSSNSSLIAYVREGDVFVRTTLKVGLVGDNHIQLLSGANAGQQIILDAPAPLAHKKRFSKGELSIAPTYST